MTGRIIAVEGPDAAGKATQCKLLKERFERADCAARVFSFHRYNTPTGEIIKAMLTGGMSLMPPGGLSVPWPGDGEGLRKLRKKVTQNAMALQALATVDKYAGAVEILDFVGDGGIAICDRWWQSAVAYGMAEGLDKEWLEDIHAFLPAADMNVLVTVPFDVARARKPRPDDRFEANQDLLVKVREHYIDLWRERRDDPDDDDEWIAISGEGSMQTVHDRLWDTGELGAWAKACARD